MPVKLTASQHARFRKILARQLRFNGPRVPGGQYRSGYRGERYTVEAMWSVLDVTTGGYGQEWLRVRWEDGQVTTHCTKWGDRDSVSWLSVTDSVLFALALDPDIPEDSELFKAVGTEFLRRFPARPIKQMDPDGVYTPESSQGTYVLGITPGGDLTLGDYS